MNASKPAEQVAPSVDLLTAISKHGQQVAELRATYAASMARDAMSYWLAVAASQLREAKERKAVHVAAELSMSESTISRFERHVTVPRDLDGIVAAYARDLDMAPIEIWSRAVALWQNHEAADGEAAPVP